jgi:hypothetical protein
MNRETALSSQSKKKTRNSEKGSETEVDDSITKETEMEEEEEKVPQTKNSY